MKAKLITTFAAAALIGLGSATPAQAAVTFGQLSPVHPADTLCNGGPFDAVQPTVTDGNSYVVPSTGGVSSWVATSWSHNASADTGQSLTMKFWRPLGGSMYMAVGHDGPRSPTPGELNTFPGLRIPVKAGDVLGITPTGLGGNNGCAFSAPADHFDYTFGVNTPDGQSFTTNSNTSGQRLNIEATLEADADNDGYGDETQDKCVGTAGPFIGCPSTVAIDKLQQKGKKPKIKVTTTVPGAGTLQVGSANDASLASASGSKTLKAVSQTITATSKQQVTLTLKLTKSAKKKLANKGKLKTKVKAVYTPTGGPAASQTAKVKLRS